MQALKELFSITPSKALWYILIGLIFWGIFTYGVMRFSDVNLKCIKQRTNPGFGPTISPTARSEEVTITTMVTLTPTSFPTNTNTPTPTYTNTPSPTKLSELPVRYCTASDKEKYMLSDDSLITVKGHIRRYKRHPEDPTDVDLPEYIIVLDKPLEKNVEVPVEELEIVTGKCGYTREDVKELVGRKVWLKGYLVTTYGEGYGIIVISAKIIRDAS